MFKAPVYNVEGQRTGERELPEALFDGVVHEAAMWQAVKAYLANQRQSNAATKTRAFVAGGARKPWRQKGTGRARQGSIRSAQWRGGSVVFGPSVERNHRQDLPKQVRRLARRSALNARAGEGAIAILEAFAFDQPKTRRIVELVAATGLSGNLLLLTAGHQPLVYVSSRNVPGLEVRPFGEETTYDVLWSDGLIIEAGALDRVAEVAHA